MREVDPGVNAHLPVLASVVPVDRESRWSDLLAALIETDPEPARRCFDLSPGSVFETRREHSADGRNRPDIVLAAGPAVLAVIEVKVLAGLGGKQLQRYQDAVPKSPAYFVVHPERLAIDTQHAPKWRSLTWESVLDEYSQSAHPWVRPTAIAWRRHLDAALPSVDEHTVWNELTDGEGFAIAMRARMSWLFAHLEVPDGVEHDLVPSSAGVSWVLRIYTPAAKAGYRVMVELEERLGVRNFPKVAGPGNRSPVGASAMVVLLQESVTTSADFDWNYLHALWPTMNAARGDWVTAVPRPKLHDKTNYLAMVANGAPKFLGVGFGERQTRITGQCMFGARIQLPADATLARVLEDVKELSSLVLDLAKIEPPAASDPALVTGGSQ